MKMRTVRRRPLLASLWECWETGLWLWERAHENERFCLLACLWEWRERDLCLWECWKGSFACDSGDACGNVEKEALLVRVVMLVRMLKRKLCLWEWWEGGLCMHSWRWKRGLHLWEWWERGHENGENETCLHERMVRSMLVSMVRKKPLLVILVRKRPLLVIMMRRRPLLVIMVRKRPLLVMVRRRPLLACVKMRMVRKGPHASWRWEWWERSLCVWEWWDRGLCMCEDENGEKGASCSMKMRMVRTKPLWEWWDRGLCLNAWKMGMVKKRVLCTWRTWLKVLKASQSLLGKRSLLCVRISVADC